MKERKEREERIEKRLELRDDNLMKMVREIQDAKRTIVLAQGEIAAAKEKLVEILEMSTFIYECTHF